MSLSSAIDRAVKAYIEHTNVVLAGDASLNISYLTQPFASITAPQQLAQLALAQQQDGTTPKLEDGEETKTGRKKRAYKPRDPNAPKRPLTAYFRFLDEMRKPIAEEMASKKPKDSGPSKPGDVSKEATVRWKAMSKEQQAPYKEAYQRSLKDYNKEVEEYKRKGGLLGDEHVGGAEEDDEEEEGESAEKKESKKAEESSTDDDDEDDSSDDDEDDASGEEEDAKPMPPPPPPKAPTPEPKKTPKSALKKKKTKEPASSQDDVPPTPQFSSINPSAPQPPPSSKKEKSSSPELKRKAAPAEDGDGKKKRKKAEKKEEEKKVPESDASENKPKKEKKRRRKSENGA